MLNKFNESVTLDITSFDFQAKIKTHLTFVHMYLANNETIIAVIFSPPVSGQRGHLAHRETASEGTHTYTFRVSILLLIIF